MLGGHGPPPVWSQLGRVRLQLLFHTKHFWTNADSSREY